MRNLFDSTTRCLMRRYVSREGGCSIPLFSVLGGGTADAAFTTSEQIDLSRISPWLLRFELDREAMSDKNMSMEDITRKIEEVYDAKTLHVICNDDNAEKLVMRIRLVNDAPEKGSVTHEDQVRISWGSTCVSDSPSPRHGKRMRSCAQDDDCNFLKKLEHDMLTSISLRGVENIKRVFMREPKREVVDKETGAVKMMSEWVLDTEG